MKPYTNNDQPSLDGVVQSKNRQNLCPSTRSYFGQNPNFFHSAQEDGRCFYFEKPSDKL